MNFELFSLYFFRDFNDAQRIEFFKQWGLLPQNWNEGLTQAFMLDVLKGRKKEIEMGKFNIGMPTPVGIVTAEAFNHANATKNLAGGLAYALDAATKLLTSAGQFFNEPTYYQSDKVGTDGLTENSRDIVNTAKAVAGSDVPQDLLSIANYLRNGKNLRTTPAVLYAIAAGEQKNRDRMVEYGPKILKRPDDVLQAFAAYFALYGRFDVKEGRSVRRATLPNSFKRGLAEALSKFDIYQLDKWDNNEWPRLRDVVRVIDRKANFPIAKDYVNFLLTGEVSDAENMAMIKARKELSAIKEWNSDIPALAKKAHATWEQLNSQFGKTNGKQVWEALIDGGRATLPIFATIRNLRNMEQAGISQDHWKKLYDLATGYNYTNILPFRFIAARRNVYTFDAMSVVDLMLDKAVANIADLPGTTAILMDLSGSMNTRISAESDMSKRDVAVALGSVLAKRLGGRAVLVPFGTNPVRSNFSVTDSTWNIFNSVMGRQNETGGSTEAGRAVALLTEGKIKVDRIILLSDMQCYTAGSRAGNVQPQLSLYAKTLSPNVKFISVDIGAGGTSVAASDNKNVYLTGGSSESIVNEILAFEGAEIGAVGETATAATASLEYVRANY